VDAVQPEKDMPKLPVARVLWKTQPSLSQAVENWIQAGGAHHTGFSYKVTSEQLRDFAELAGIEFLIINNDTNTHAFNNEIRWNDVTFR
jgi:L-arabinose isomerase